MNTNIKDKIKMAIAVSVLVLIIITVIVIIIQYEVEGEKNMSYKLSKVMIISTAEGEENIQDTEETAKWNLNINQNNDIYFFIDKNDENSEEIIDSVTINNIIVTKAPQIGTIATYMPNSTEGRTFLNKEEYRVKDKLEYKGSVINNSKTLEISNQGGSVSIRISNNNIGKLISDEENEIKHDGSLITKVGVSEEQIEFQISFDLIIQINKINYKTTISLNLPTQGICENGTTTTELIQDSNEFVFKRIKG